MADINKSKTNILVDRWTNLMYDCIANSVVHLSTVLDDDKRVQAAKKAIDKKIKKSIAATDISYRIGLISFDHPTREDLNPVQIRLVEYYEGLGHTVELSTMSYHLETTKYLTLKIST